MDKEKRIEEEVNKTLEVFEQIPPVQENPYLFTKIKVRLDAENETQEENKIFSGFLRPAFLALVFALNVITAVYFFSSNYTNQQANSYSLVNQLNEEYAINKVSLTDLNLE